MQYEPDGSWEIVIAPRDPGHPNWVSTAGHHRGWVWFRWFLPERHARAAVVRGGAVPASGMTGHDRPAPDRLDDLVEPRFTDEVRAILDLMGEAGRDVDLRPETLMATATDETGLERLRARRLRGPPGGPVPCPAATRPELNHAGLLTQSLLLTGLLRNRLLLEDLVARHPEILDETIASPIIICGLPRTGHHPPAQPDVVRPGPPVPALLGEPRTGPGRCRASADGPGRSAARARCEPALSFVNTAMPEFKRMHEMTVDHVHEEIQLLAMDVSSMLFETIAPMPTWRDDYLARDQRPSYGYLKKILQALQWLRGGTRWVLKSPQHLEQFPALVDTFPDADVRRHPPRPGIGDGLHGHHARLLGPTGTGPGRPRSDRGLLVRPAGTDARGLRPGS